MIQDLSGKEKSALLGAAEIALGLMDKEVEAPRVPRPASEHPVEKVMIFERPLSAEETADHAWGDPFMEHGLVAAGKKLCGMCVNKAKDKWRCLIRTFDPGQSSESLPCPALNIGCAAFLKKPSTPRPPQIKKKGLPVPLGIKFLYYGRPQSGASRHHGVVTVAWISPAPGTLLLSFAFCSPKDRWCKVTGRDMALARLIHPLIIPFLYSPKRTVYEVVRAVLSHDLERLALLTPGRRMWGGVPSWTKNLIKGMEVRERVLRRICAPLFEPTGAQILARMMRDIMQMEDQ